MENASFSSGYAPVNGLRLYYEIHGQGRPLLVLHGGLSSTQTLAPLIARLCPDRQVIALDLPGHGRSTDHPGPWSRPLLAADVAALLAHLGLSRADLLGYSFGGAVALQTAISYPQLVGRLVVVSAPFASSGYYPEVRAAIGQLDEQAAEAMKPSPMYQHYAAVAPHPEHWPQLVVKTRDLLAQPYDRSAEVAALIAPTLLVFADADSVPPAHIVRFYELLGGGQRDAGWDGAQQPASRLAILPGCTHYNVCDSPLLVPAVVAFLDSAPQ